LQEAVASPLQPSTPVPVSTRSMAEKRARDAKGHGGEDARTSCVISRLVAVSGPARERDRRTPKLVIVSSSSMVLAQAAQDSMQPSLSCYAMHQTQRGAALASSPSIAKPRSTRDRNSVALRGADLTRGEDPGHQRGRPRHKTMRHWITSFRLFIGRRDVGS
jgi:hypothetical protein